MNYYSKIHVLVYALCLIFVCFIDGKFCKRNMFNLFTYSFYALRNGEENKKEKTELLNKMRRKTFCEFFMDTSELYELLCIIYVLWYFFFNKNLIRIILCLD
jgi:hypothetical protein